MNKWFNIFANKVSSFAGRSYTFTLAVGIIVIWAFSGPFLGFSDTWQLIINTLTTLITFLMVFIIQNSQNKSDNSQQVKLDVILKTQGFDDEKIRNLENLTDQEVEEILREIQKNNRIKK